MAAVDGAATPAVAVNPTEQTTTVKTSGGDRSVTYKLYQHLTYVANPIDANYQSLNVKVPTKVDGQTIDASKAPILLAIGVGGYMSSANVAGVGGAPGGGMPSRSAAPGGNSNASAAADLALAAGYVVVQPGCRGRDNKAADGTFYGKAPAAIVDLKAAVRYLRHNKATIPGNTDWIVSRGTSAGGALSARPATASCTTPTSRSSAPPTNPTPSSLALTSARLPTSSTPTWPTSGSSAPCRRAASR